MIQHLIKLKSKKHNRDRGFTTLEILISLFIALGFVAVSMQSLVYAMAMKVQAQEKQRANQLIQEDIERLNQLGSDTGLGGVCEPANYATGYASNLWTRLDAVASGDSSSTSVTQTLLRSIKSDGTADTGGRELGLRRFHVSNSSSIFPHRTLKIRYQVWEWDGSNFVDDAGNTVTSSTTDEPIAETYVEVIPNVALACP